MFSEFFGEDVGLTEQTDPSDLMWGDDEDVIAHLMEVERQGKGMRGREDRDGLQFIVEDT